MCVALTQTLSEPTIVALVLQLLIFAHFIMISVSLFILLANAAVAFTHDVNQVVFVILYQSGHRHEKIADETRQKLTQSLASEGVAKPRIYDLHNDFRSAGSWAIFPLLPLLDQVSSPDDTEKWFVFINEASEINLQMFKDILSRYQSGMKK